jgi:hypothetical protein
LKLDLAELKSCRLNSRNACSNARTAASVPGDGGFFGGAGSGSGGNILRAARRALRGRTFGAGFLEARTFDVALRAEAPFDLALDEELLRLFFLGMTFFTGRLFSLDELAGLLLLAGASLFAGAVFLALGDAVILPGLVGFLVGDFLALVDRIFEDAEERLFVALVIRPLIYRLEAENEPAARLNPAHTLV